MELLVQQGNVDLLSHDSVLAQRSIRSKAQWFNKYPTHKVVELRGTVNTRMQKLHDNPWNGAIFDAAGLERINLKPENFLIGGTKKTSTLHVIDFGLTKRYVNPKTGKHISFKDGKDIIGTIRYVSINTHKGIEQSRRDDLESLGFLFMYLLCSKLPWQGIKCKFKKQK